MTKSKYGKYIISDPKVVNVAYHPNSEVKGVTFQDEIVSNISIGKTNEVSHEKSIK